MGTENENDLFYYDALAQTPCHFDMKGYASILWLEIFSILILDCIWYVLSIAGGDLYCWAYLTMSFLIVDGNEHSAEMYRIVGYLSAIFRCITQV